MRLALLAVLLAILLHTQAPAQYAVESIEKLTILTTSDDGELEVDGYCTAFSINQRDGAWLTAAHCAGDAYEIDGQSLRQVKLDPRTDLMILVGPRALSLKRESRTPKAGDEIHTTGMAYGTDFVWPFWGRVTFTRLEDKDLESLRAAKMVSDMKSAPGMSGGPIFSKRNRVISVHQGRWSLEGGLSLALSAPYEDLKEFTEGYWDR